MISLVVSSLLLTPSPAAQTETCAQVEQDRQREERSIGSRVDQLKAQEQDEIQAGKGEMERGVKFLEFQADLEAFEQRYTARRANCTKTG